MAAKTNINNGRGGIINPETGAADAKIPYKPEWEAKSADTAKNHMFDEPYAHCLPAGVPDGLSNTVFFAERYKVCPDQALGRMPWAAKR